MKTQLSKFFFSAMCAVMTLTSSAVFAQAKIGTNPTIIGANNNLEVEATNNKKVIVHKNDGTMVIESTPSGAATDSILSVDAAGNVRKISAARIVRPPVYSFEMTAPAGNWDHGVQGTGFPLTFPDNSLVTPNSAISDRLDDRTWKAPAAGVYRVDLIAMGMANNNVSGIGILGVNLRKNGSITRTAGVTISTYGPTANRGVATVTISQVMILVAGDTIGADAGSCAGCGPDFYWVTDRYLRIQRLE